MEEWEFVSKGDWVEFTSNGKNFTGYVIKYVELIDSYLIKVPNKRNALVESERLNPLLDVDYTQGNEFLIDLALQTGDEDWFKKLTSPSS